MSIALGSFFFLKRLFFFPPSFSTPSFLFASLCLQLFPFPFFSFLYSAVLT